MTITGTHINYFLVCQRKLWLFSHSIQMEHTNDAVEEGKLIHETAYPQRASKYEEIQVEGVKIDYYDTKKKQIHEIKKSSKLREAHLWQLKYYLFVLEKNGIEVQSGLLEYPTERQTEEVWLSEVDREIIKGYLVEIQDIIENEKVPDLIHHSRCKKCSYYDFCYINEKEK